MNLDITTILIGLIVLGLVIMLIGLVVSRRKPPAVERRAEGRPFFFWTCCLLFLPLT